MIIAAKRSKELPPRKIKTVRLENFDEVFLVRVTFLADFLLALSIFELGIIYDKWF